MPHCNRIIWIVGLAILSASSLPAQAPDPSGHWEGAVHIRNSDMAIAVDLQKNPKGEFAGTFNQPAQGVKGLPLAVVAVAGTAVRFVVKADAGASTFEGTLSEDGYALAGDVSTQGYLLPFSLTWTGVAQFAPIPKNAAIGKEFEGSWNGALDVEGTQKRIVMNIQNHADGTASGTIASPDGSGVEIAIGMTQKGSSLTIDVPSIGASYAGVLDAAGKEMSGTWTQGPSVLPLKFRLGPG